MCYGQEDEKCETGLIEAMAKSSTTSAAKIISVPITLLLTLRKSTKFSYNDLLQVKEILMKIEYFDSAIRNSLTIQV